jgi:hypothetical protein
MENRFIIIEIKKALPEHCVQVLTNSRFNRFSLPRKVKYFCNDLNCTRFNGDQFGAPLPALCATSIYEGTTFTLAIFLAHSAGTVVAQLAWSFVLHCDILILALVDVNSKNKTRFCIIKRV